MPSVSLVVTSKWRSRPPILVVPGHGIVKRPGLGKILITNYKSVANWLIGNGYCTLLESEIPPEPLEPVEVDRQVYIDQDSHLQLLPPIESDAPLESDRLIVFFVKAKPAEINSTISAISLKKAQELKQVELLEWTDVVRILSEGAIDSAIKWVQTSV